MLNVLVCVVVCGLGGGAKLYVCCCGLPGWPVYMDVMPVVDALVHLHHIRRRGHNVGAGQVHRRRAARHHIGGDGSRCTHVEREVSLYLALDLGLHHLCHLCQLGLVVERAARHERLPHTVGGPPATHHLDQRHNAVAAHKELRLQESRNEQSNTATVSKQSHSWHSVQSCEVAPGAVVCELLLWVRP